MTDLKDRTPAAGFNRRAFIGGAAALPMVARAASDVAVPQSHQTRACRST
jgi:hypothetical protein